MSILLDSSTRVIVQGITGREGQFHTRNMKAAGTKIVGGVTPGKGGTTTEGVPVFDTVEEADTATDARASCIFVPPRGAADAIMEAASAGIKLDRLHHRGHSRDRYDTRYAGCTRIWSAFDRP